MTSRFPASTVAALATIVAALCFAIPPSGATDFTLQDRVFAARDRVMPALVHVEPILEVFRMGERGQVAVTGSGVIFSADGYVVTNNHVVENARRVTCTLSNQEEVEAELVGRDPLSDLAILRLPDRPGGGSWPHADLGNSSTLQVGEYVVAMGSPLGLSRSLSVGVISSLNRYIPESQMPSGSPTGLYNTWIQTDAAINPGNSGGPLVNLDGQVIGINARAVPVFGENIGFAIPIDMVREVAPQLIAKGEVTRSWIGANWQHMKSLTAFFGLGEAKGVLVGSVIQGSPAEAAGLLAGDIVLEYDGEPINVWFEEDIPTFEKRLANTPVGREVPLRVLREGEEMSVSLVTQARAKTEGDQKENRRWGFTVREITDEEARLRNLVDVGGVLISGIKPGSFAAEAGLRPGDVVVRMEDVEVANLAHWSQIYQQAVDDQSSQVLVTVRRGPAHFFHVIRPIYEDTDAQ